MRNFLRRHPDLLFVFLMTLIMGLTLSFIFTLQREGFSASFIGKWLYSFVSTYVLVVPTVLVASPLARYLQKRIIGEHDS